MPKTNTTKKTAKQAASRAKTGRPAPTGGAQGKPNAKEVGTGAQDAKGATQAPAKTKATKAPKEELVVFAFRLTPEEREAIHKAAGPAKASKFVRALARAAAKRDLAAVTQIVEAIEV